MPFCFSYAHGISETKMKLKNCSIWEREGYSDGKMKQVGHVQCWKWEITMVSMQVRYRGFMPLSNSVRYFCKYWESLSSPLWGCVRHRSLNILPKNDGVFFPFFFFTLYCVIYFFKKKKYMNLVLILSFLCTIRHSLNY